MNENLYPSWYTDLQRLEQRVDTSTESAANLYDDLYRIGTAMNQNYPGWRSGLVIGNATHDLYRKVSNKIYEKLMADHHVRTDIMSGTESRQMNVQQKIEEVKQRLEANSANAFGNPPGTERTRLQKDVVGSAATLAVLMAITPLMPRKWRLPFWAINFVCSGLTSIPSAFNADNKAERRYHAGWVAVGLAAGIHWYRKVVA